MLLRCGPRIRFEENEPERSDMKNDVVRNLTGFVLVLVIISAAAAQPSQPTSSLGISVSTDMDCVVAIDDKVVGRVQNNRHAFFPAAHGRHMLVAATSAGDYWEQAVDIGSEPGLSVTVSFRKVRADRIALEQKVTELRKQVSEDAKELARLQETNKAESRNAEMRSSRRHSIVEAINYYSDRWGKELGLRDSRYESVQNLDDTLTTQGLQNMGNPDPYSQATMEAVMGIEWLAQRRLKAKLHRNQLAVAAASGRMEYLGKALEDPLKHAPDNLDSGYLAIVQDVKRNKDRGKLLTAPDRIEYSDRSGVVKISCSSLRGASGGKELHLVYQESATQPKQHLDVQAIQKSDRETLLGNVYLACPELTQ